jgi:ribosomal protein L11 methyltransferase
LDARLNEQRTTDNGQKTWHALDFLIEPQASEAVEYALMEAGALGTEEGNEQDDGLMRVTAYFDSIPQREDIREALFDALRIYNLPSSSAREMRLREVENKDWLGEWKANWQPVCVGERFIIAPPWSEVSANEDKIIIRIEPGMAFGTGTHETTKLCLAAIEKHFKGGSFSDVGTGTGILAIAAAKLSPSSRIEACDTDAEAVGIARENAALNNVDQQISFSVGSIDETAKSADFICANLTADVIVPMLPALIGATCGRLVLSGILETQENQVCSRLHELGVDQFEVEHDGEWVAITV